MRDRGKEEEEEERQKDGERVNRGKWDGRNGEQREAVSE